MPEAKITVSAQDLASDVFAKVKTDIGSMGEAVTGAIEHPFDAAKTAATSFVEELGAVGAAASVAGGILVATGAALLEMGEHAASVSAGIESLALRSGDSTENISKLKFAADVAGGSIEGLTNVSYMMSVRLGDAGAAGDKAREAVGRLGVDLQAFIAAGPSERILMISDALRTTSLSGDEVRNSLMALGGRGVRDQIDVLSKDLRGLADDGVAVGAVLSEQDAKAAEEFEMQSRKLHEEWDLFTRSIGSTFIPALTDLAKAINHATVPAAQPSANGALIDPAALALQDKYGAALKQQGTYAAESAASLDGLSINIHQSAAEAAGAADAHAKLAAHLAALHEQAVPLTDSQKALALELKAGGDSAKDIATWVGAAEHEVTSYLEAVKQAADAQEKYNAQMADANSSIRDLSGAQIEGIKAEHDRHVSIEEIVAEFDVYKHQVEAVVTVEKDQAANELALAKQAKQIIDERVKAQATATAEINAHFKENQDLTETMIAAHADYVSKTTLGMYDYQREQIDTWTVDELEKIDYSRSNWEETYDAITQTAADKYDAVAKTEADALSLMHQQELSWANEFNTLFLDLPGEMQKAFSGSGGIEGLFSSVAGGVGSDIGGKLFAAGGPLNGLGNSITKGATDLFGSSFGDAIGLALPAVGSLIGPAISGIIGKIANIGGPSAEELAGRKTEGQFETQMGGLAGMQKALMDAGLSADEANAKIQALWAAEKSGGAAVQTQIDGINSTIKQHATDVSTGVTDILNAAKGVGANFPEALKPAIDQLEKMPGLTDAEKQSLDALTSSGTPDLQTITAAASKYGMTIDDLGGKAKQLSISTQADQIEGDYKMLMDTGADAGTVLSHMSKSVSDLVDNAMKYGSALPTAMQPIVKAMFDAGELTDSTGKKITDMSGIKFDDTSDPLAKGLSNLTDTINKLIKLLSGDVPDAAKTAADGIAGAFAGVKSPTIDVHYKVDGSTDTPTSYAAEGGYVTSRGVQYFDGGGSVMPGGPRGTDTVPAWLTPGETVLSRPQTGQMFGGMAAMHEEIKSLRGDLRAQADLHAMQLATLPMMLRHALRGTGA